MTLRDKILKSILNSESQDIVEKMERLKASLGLVDLEENLKQRIFKEKLENSRQRYGSTPKINTAMEFRGQEDYL